MRKTLLFLLAASAAAPAFAAADDDDRSARREAARAERAERVQSARSQRQAEQPQPAERSQRPAEARPVEPRARNLPVAIERRGGEIQPRVLERRSGPGAELPRPTLEQRREAVDSVREWQARERRVGNRPAGIEQRGQGPDSLRERRARDRTGPAAVEQGNGTFREVLAPRRAEGPGARDSIGNRRAPVISRVPREGTQPPPPAATRPSSLTARHWRGDWRSDDRYDWRKHRNRHRSLFRFGVYFDPFGWSYRPYSIGWRLWPNYYRSSYWLNDPWMYRLPHAPPGYRWIRYYNDALLVDTWDGQVVDVIRNFFW